MLYTPDQRKARLNIGFRGRPVHRAGVFRSQSRFKQRGAMALDRGAYRDGNFKFPGHQSIRFGSLFGGTGRLGCPPYPGWRSGAERKPEVLSIRGSSAVAVLLIHSGHLHRRRTLCQSRGFLLMRGKLALLPRQQPGFNRIT